MNYKSIPWFPRTWKLFLDHSQPEQARCIFSNFISFGFFFLFCAFQRVALRSFRQSLEFWPWIVKRERYIFLSQEVSQFNWDFKSALLALEGEGRRSQVRDLRDTAEGSQSDSFKGTKKKEKAEADKIGKDAMGLRQSACSGWLWSKKSFQVRGNQGMDL